jgi:hypothetical protein
MGFWDTFVKVWQVRVSVKIQESFDKSFRVAKKTAETQANIHEINNELVKKNQSWDAKINNHRKNNRK